MSIVVSNLTKNYGKQKALDQVSFSLNPGEIVGLLGPNGAGKSTCMRIIAGAMGGYEGQVSVAGYDVNSESVQARHHVGYLPEHNPLYIDMYVREYLSFVGSLYRKLEVRNRVDALIEITGLTAESHKKIESLSKGYRQRVGLAQALLHDPSVVILDEPTTGLDPNQLVQIRHLIRDLGKDKTILFSSHILAEVEALCDRVLVLNQGALVANRSLDSASSGTYAITVEFDRQADAALFSDVGAHEIEQLSPTGIRLLFPEHLDRRGDIFDRAVSSSLRILSMQRSEQSVGAIFSSLTKNDAR